MLTYVSVRTYTGHIVVKILKTSMVMISKLMFSSIKSVHFIMFQLILKYIIEYLLGQYNVGSYWS